jgi:hypothetical protein
MSFGETMFAGSPGSHPPLGVAPSNAPPAHGTPQAAQAPHASPGANELVAKAPAHTAAPLSRTTAGGNGKSSRSMFGVLALLAVVLVLVGVGLVLLRKTAKTGGDIALPEQSSKPSAAAQTAVSPPALVPSVAVEPVLVPPPTVSALTPPQQRPASSASAEPRRPERPAKGASTSRAKEHGLSEENPF